jgi:lipoyl synthase
MRLHFAVVTGVARDDLPDGGAWLFAETCRQIKQPASQAAESSC